MYVLSGSPTRTLQNMYVMYKLRFCASSNLYKMPVQVATRTRMAVQVVPCTEFHHQIIPTCTILLYKLDLQKNIG